KSMNFVTNINFLPKDILLTIFEKIVDIKLGTVDIKLRQVSKRWKALIDTEVFKRIFQSYEISPILKLRVKIVKQQYPNENYFQKVITVYLTIKGNIKTDPPIKNATLSVSEIERLEKIYQEQHAPYLVNVFVNIGQQYSAAYSFLNSIKNISQIEQAD